MNVQIIEKNGKPGWAVIPFLDYKKIQEALEDAEDIKEIEENLKAIQEGKEITMLLQSYCRHIFLAQPFLFNYSKGLCRS